MGFIACPHPSYQVEGTSVDHPKHTKLHINYIEGNLAEEGPILMGESPWAIPVKNKPFHYKIDNLLVGTTRVGLFDIVRCKDVGTDWGDKEVVELVEGHKCWRGVTLLPDKAEEFITLLQERFSLEEVQIEGGMGILALQCEPEVAEDLMDILDSTDLIDSYSLNPVNIDY